MRCYVLMGVMGSGKTSIGQAMAEQAPTMTFIDGDSLHPAHNIEKMSRGEPLTDADRAPWLSDVGRTLATTPSFAVIGCSALKRGYRDIIRLAAAEPVRFLHLHTTKEVLAKRVGSRDGHFMPPALLESQLATLEPLQPDEDGRVIDIDRPLGDVVTACLQHIDRVAV